MWRNNEPLQYMYVYVGIQYEILCVWVHGRKERRHACVYCTVHPKEWLWQVSSMQCTYLLNYAGVFPFSLPFSFSLSFSPPHSHSHSHPTFTLPSFYLTAVLPFTAHHDINILVACPAHRGMCLQRLLLLPLLILPRIPHFFFFSLLPQPLGRRRRRRTGVVVGLVAGVE